MTQEDKKLLLADVMSQCAGKKCTATENLRLYLGFRIVKWGDPLTFPAEKLFRLNAYCSPCAKKNRFRGFNADKVWGLPNTIGRGVGEK